MFFVSLIKPIRNKSMNELIFLVEEDPQGGFNARALGESIFTQADTYEELKAAIKEAVECHFDEPTAGPKVIRLHYVKEEVFAL